MFSIAIVDDNPDNTLFLKILLKDKYKILIFNSGNEALVGFYQELPDLVLMDISLPGMDGIEVLNQMKEDPKLKFIPVIALTAHAQQEEISHYLAEGFDDYLSKPIMDDSLLIEKIEKLLSYKKS